MTRVVPGREYTRTRAKNSADARDDKSGMVASNGDIVQESDGETISQSIYRKNYLLDLQRSFQISIQ